MEQTRKTQTGPRRPRSWAVGMWLGRRFGASEPIDKMAEQIRDWGGSTYEVKP